MAAVAACILASLARVQHKAQACLREGEKVLTQPTRHVNEKCSESCVFRFLAGLSAWLHAAEQFESSNHFGLTGAKPVAPWGTDLSARCNFPATQERSHASIE